MKVLNRICVQRIGNAHQMHIRGTNTRALGYNNFTNSEDKDKCRLIRVCLFCEDRNIHQVLKKYIKT